MPRYTPEEAEKVNKFHEKKNDRDYQRFKKDVEQGICWVCKYKLSSFDVESPCQHWLIRPEGVRKIHIKQILNHCTYDMLEGFLRWYCNVHMPFQGINDIEDEHDGSKIKALTIKHGDNEWSFSFSEGCLKGLDGKHGPHYHFQMRVNAKQFFNYSYHVKLNEYELWQLDIFQGKNPDFAHRETHGIGMGEIMDKVDPETLLDSMRSTTDENKATFHLDTIVEAEPGQTISGDDIADLLEESRETGVPMAKLVKKLKGTRTRVLIEPGDGVPVPAERKRKRKRQKNNE